MAITTYADYVTAVSNNNKRIPFYKVNIVSISTSPVRWQSMWTNGPGGGTAPTTAVAPTNATAGSITVLWQDLGTITKQLYVAGVEVYSGSANGPLPTSFILIDRLSHQGGLDGTVTTSQTTNLPTAALTRYTSAVNVMAAFELYTNIGSTAQTATITYTNSSGTASRTSKAVAIGGTTGAGNAPVFLPIPLQDGDVGVQSVQSVLLSGSTGTAGNFGVTLYMVVHVGTAQQGLMNVRIPYRDALICGPGDLFPISSTACLTGVCISNAAGIVPQFVGTLVLIEG